jgi:hypothetical protein
MSFYKVHLSFSLSKTSRLHSPLVGKCNVVSVGMSSKYSRSCFLLPKFFSFSDPLPVYLIKHCDSFSECKCILDFLGRWYAYDPTASRDMAASRPSRDPRGDILHFLRTSQGSWSGTQYVDPYSKQPVFITI